MFVMSVKLLCTAGDDICHPSINAQVADYNYLCTQHATREIP